MIRKGKYYEEASIVRRKGLSKEGIIRRKVLLQQKYYDKKYNGKESIMRRKAF